MSIKTQKLSAVLNKIENIPWNFTLYALKQKPLASDSKCIVLDEEKSDQETLTSIKKKGFLWTLNIQTVQEIISNLKQQLPEAGLAKMIEAVKFYLDNDAFIEVKNS